MTARQIAASGAIVNVVFALWQLQPIGLLVAVVIAAALWFDRA